MNSHESDWMLRTEAEIQSQNCAMKVFDNIFALYIIRKTSHLRTGINHA